MKTLLILIALFISTLAISQVEIIEDHDDYVVKTTTTNPDGSVVVKYSKKYTREQIVRKLDKQLEDKYSQEQKTLDALNNNKKLQLLKALMGTFGEEYNELHRHDLDDLIKTYTLDGWKFNRIELVIKEDGTVTMSEGKATLEVISRTYFKLTINDIVFEFHKTGEGEYAAYYDGREITLK